MGRHQRKKRDTGTSRRREAFVKTETRTLRSSLAQKIVSWNMQGAGVEKLTRVRNWMDDKSIRLICLQECGDLGGWVDVTSETKDSGLYEGTLGEFKIGLYLWKIENEDRSTSSSSSSSSSIAASSSITSPSAAVKGNIRCSLAMLCRDPQGTITSRFPTDRETHRPALECKFYHAPLQKSLMVFNVHAPSGGTKQTQLYIQNLIIAGKMSQTPFALVGDHNQSPEETLGTDDIAILSSGIATHQGSGELDYATVSSSLAGDASVGAGGSSDHFPVFITITGEVPVATTTRVPLNPVAMAKWLNRPRR